MTHTFLGFFEKSFLLIVTTTVCRFQKFAIQQPLVCQKVECHILISQLVFTLEDFWEFLLHLFLPLNGVRRGCPR